MFRIPCDCCKKMMVVKDLNTWICRECRHEHEMERARQYNEVRRQMRQSSRDTELVEGV